MTNEEISLKVPRVLVVGAGLAGMTAAHYLAEWGAHIYLIDRAPYIGGAFLFVDHTFTTDSCGLCIALPRQPAYCPTISSELHPRISPLPCTLLVALDEKPGHRPTENSTGSDHRFVATLRREPRYVDPGRCDNCGACAAVCPATRPNPYNGDLVTQRAIYPPPSRAVPFSYGLDLETCTRCGACVAACPHNAIDLNATPTEEQVKIDAVVLAPGFAFFNASRAAGLGWGRCRNVVTNLQFERMLSRGGPTRGQILRPSDGKTARHIAFIQCVGSRNPSLGRPYCSTSCCMITAKQVGLAKEISPGTAVTVFTMDVRAAGKGYERYVQRVAALPGVIYRRGMVSAVQEIPSSRNLRLLTPDGEQEFDLVVLAVGLGPVESVQTLAACAGIALDERGFILLGDEGPGTTSRAGVFAIGANLPHVDVPETVTQAAAAAAMAASTLQPPSLPSPPCGEYNGERKASKRHAPHSQETSAPKQETLVDQPPRIALFLCTCHGTLERSLDFPALTAAARRKRAVAHVECLAAACEPAGLSAIEHTVAEHAINRVVVAGCSPRLHASRFDALIARMNLPARLLARANVREGAAWPHLGDREAATAVAWGQIEMAVAGLRETPYRALPSSTHRQTIPRVLVLGGGLAGMMAALTLADLSVACDLLEREAHLGGNLRQIQRTLEGTDVKALLNKTIERVQEADSVRTWIGAELAGWSGARGDFTAQVRVNGEIRTEQYGALIVATGAEEAETMEYLRGQHPRVVTQRELERMLVDWETGKSGTWENDRSVNSVVMIQCAGSRDESHPYCSRVCCAQAIKNALALKAVDPAIEISVLFRDVRTLGLQELYYQQARRLGVRFLRYEPPEKPIVEADGNRLRITVHDTLYDETLVLPADLLVLSTGIVPRSRSGTPEDSHLAGMLSVPLDEDGFFAEAHPKLRPTDLPRPGLFVCGLAYGPRFISETIAQARAAALHAALVVARPPAPHREFVTVEPELCSFCGLCVTVCPYGARVLDEGDRCAHVLDHLCHGCGSCVAVCPNGASRQPAFEPVAALARIDAALTEVELCEGCP